MKGPGGGRLERSHLSYADRRVQVFLSAAIAVAAFAAAVGLGLVPVPDSWRRAAIRMIRPPPPIVAPIPGEPAAAPRQSAAG